MSEITLKIEGMTCQHCVVSVKKAIDAVEGVRRSEVSIGTAVVKLDDTKTDSGAVAEAVRNAGYKVTDWKSRPIG